MRLRATTLGLAWAVCCLGVTALHAQPPADTRTPAQLFADARELIKEGRYDVAAERLKSFLAANPTDQDFLAITKNEPTAFLRLRNVAVWSDNPGANAEAVKTVEEIIKRSEEANKKVYTDPARIGKFVRNLGATPEERVYAEQQLKLSGTAVIPVMVEVLRTSTDVPQRAGILSAISKLGVETIPGFIAAMDGLSDDIKLGVIRALAARPDLFNLVSMAETDFTPNLWYYSAAPGEEAASLRAFSKTLLSQLSGGRSDRVRPEAELTRLAEPFVRKTARYRDPAHLALWTWDPARQNVSAVPATKAQADDYYAVKYLRWALDRSPNHAPAQDVFLTHAVERAVEKARFGDLAQSDPTLYQILATAPSAQLIALLEDALSEHRTAVALGLTQVLAARADKAAASAPSPGKPSVFGKALDYPDARVQFAAAIGLLRAPVTPDHGQPARVVEVLRRAAAADPGPVKEKEVGRALIVDPLDARAEKVAGFLRQLGYSTERFPTSRDLLRRVARAADFDLLVIDRHTADPTLIDLLAQLRQNPAAASRPALVLASADKPRPVPLEHLILRLALLIAATETSSLEIPPPFFFDPRKTIPDVAAERTRVGQLRDRRLQEVYRQRLDRLTRLVEAANLVPSRELQARLDVRLPQATYAVLAAEYQVTEESAPTIWNRFQVLNTEIRNQPDLTRMTIDVSTATLGRLVEQLDLVLTPERRALFDQLALKVNPNAILLPADTSRDVILEDHLARQVRMYKGVTVVPEPFSFSYFAEEVRTVSGDPASMPRDPAERKLSAKLAVEWLRRLAVGEIPGFDVRPAEATLRDAMRDDDLAPAAIEAVGRIPTAAAQQDLLFVALSGMRPAPIRMKAAEQTVRHIQAFGKLTPANQIGALAKAAEAEANVEMRAKLLVIQQLLAGKPEDLGKLIANYPIPLPPPPPAPKEPVPGAEGQTKKEDTPKKPDEGKN